MGISFMISVQVFPHLTNRIHSEHWLLVKNVK